MSQLVSGKKKKRAEGYSDTSHPLVYHPVPLSEFVTSQCHMELLREASCLQVDVDMFRRHPATSEELLLAFKVSAVLFYK